MKVDELMTISPETCSGEDTLQTVATMMRDGDFGAIAVVDNQNKPIGILTDRDIAVRAVAEGHGAQTRVEAMMSKNCCSVPANTTIDKAIQQMEKQQLRRLVVTNEKGAVCGMLALADVAEKLKQETAGEVVAEISR